MNYKLRTSQKILSIIIIQVFLLTQFDISPIFFQSNYETLRIIRGGSEVYIPSKSIPEPLYEPVSDEGLDPTQRKNLDQGAAQLTQKDQEVKEVLKSTIKSWIEEDIGILPPELEYQVEIISDALAGLSISFGVTEEKLMGLINNVLNNIEVILPSFSGVDLIGTHDSGYILPWIRVAVETAIREDVNTLSEISSKLQEIFEVLSNPEVINDAKVLLDLEWIDFTNPSQVAELAEYARVIVIQNKIEEIIRNNLGNSAVAKYQGLSGIVIQMTNWLQAPSDIVLEKFSTLISNVTRLENEIRALTGNSSLDNLIPWIAVGLIEGIENKLEGDELIKTLIDLVEISKGSDIQADVVSKLKVESLDFTNIEQVIYLALNGKTILSQRNIRDLLDRENLGAPNLRETLATYLFSIKTIFDIDDSLVIEKLKSSLNKVEGLLNQISELNGKQVTMNDKEILPWIWLDMVLDLDPEATTNIENILSFANTERGQFITSYLIGDKFNPTDPSNVAMLAAARELAEGRSPVPTPEIPSAVTQDCPANSPITIEELEKVTEDENITQILDGALERIRENYYGRSYDEGKVKRALAFLTLVKGDPKELIPDLSDIELIMAQTAHRMMSREEVRDVYNKAVEIVRNIRTGGIDRELPTKVEPSGFDWKSALFRFASTVVAAGIATGVYLAGESKFSSELFKAWLGFITYVNVKPMVEFGLSGIVDMFMPHKAAPEVTEIVKNGVPDNHRGMVIRQMYVVKDSQLEEDVLIGEWLKNREENGNVLLAIVIDVDTEEFRQKTIDAYERLIQNHPEYKDEIYLFIRNKGNWEFDEAYNRKEGRIDDLLTYIFKGKKFPETHLEGPKADLRAKDRHGNIRILGDNFYIDANTRELKDKRGNVVLDKNGKPITEDRITFEHVYVVENDKLYGAYGNLIAGKNEFIVDKEKGIITFVKTPYRTEDIQFKYLIEDGKLYKGSQLISSSPDFIGDKGQIMVDVITGDILETKDGKIIRGNYIGLDLRRDPFEPLFTDIRGNIENLHIGDEERRVKYIFVIDEDTTLPEGSARKMIAKFAHPDNSQYVIMQPALKNTNAYDSMFTRVDTLAREMLRFSEFTNWKIFGGIMYGKWGARVKEYYEQLVEKEVADPTARSEDERPTLYVPVLGLNDVFWGDEPKRTFYQFLARLKEWTIGDIQTVLKEYLPRMLWGYPYKIYSKIQGRDFKPLPKLSSQGQRILTNLARSVYAPAAFGILLLSYLTAGTLPGLYTLTSQTVSKAITAGIVFGAILGIGKFLAPVVRDLRTQGFDFGTIYEDAKRAFTEFLWSTGLFIPFIWVKSAINWWAYSEIRRADKEARMVPRTPGVIISEMERVENLPTSYRKLLGSPIIGSLAITDLAVVNPMALAWLTPIAYAFLSQPTLAFKTEKTTVSLKKAIEGIEARGGSYSLVGGVFSEVYASVAEETMADEKLNRLLKLELKFEKAFKYLESNPNSDLEYVIKVRLFNDLTEQERMVVLEIFGNDDIAARDALYEYMKAIYHERVRIEAEETADLEDKAEVIKAFKLRAYSQALIRNNPDRENLVDAARDMYEKMDDVSNIHKIDEIVEDLIRIHKLEPEEEKLFRYYIKLARR